MSHPLAVVVMGVCGSGKTTIGRALADHSDRGDHSARFGAATRNCL